MVVSIFFFIPCFLSLYIPIRPYIPIYVSLYTPTYQYLLIYPYMFVCSHTSLCAPVHPHISLRIPTFFPHVFLKILIYPYIYIYISLNIPMYPPLRQPDPQVLGRPRKDEQSSAMAAEGSGASGVGIWGFGDDTRAT